MSSAVDDGVRIPCVCLRGAGGRRFAFGIGQDAALRDGGEQRDALATEIEAPKGQGSIRSPIARPEGMAPLFTLFCNRVLVNADQGKPSGDGWGRRSRRSGLVRGYGQLPACPGPEAPV